MYTSFTVKNFRGFHDLTLEPLERVNLIAGKNSVGKTALLEALFLHLGPANPRLPLTIGLLRGIHQVAVNPDVLWGWLFPSKRLDRIIEVTSQSDDGVQRSLEIALVEPATSRIVPPGNGKNTVAEAVPAVTTTLGTLELLLSYHDCTGQSGTSRAFFHG